MIAWARKFGQQVYHRENESGSHYQRSSKPWNSLSTPNDQHFFICFPPVTQCICPDAKEQEQLQQGQLWARKGPNSLWCRLNACLTLEVYDTRTELLRIAISLWCGGWEKKSKWVSVSHPQNWAPNAQKLKDTPDTVAKWFFAKSKSFFSIHKKWFHFVATYTERWSQKAETNDHDHIDFLDAWLGLLIPMWSFLMSFDHFCSFVLILCV